MFFFLTGWVVKRIASLDVRDDSEIDWKLLNDDDWNLWSAHSLQRRWLSLKRSVEGIRGDVSSR